MERSEILTAMAELKLYGMIAFSADWTGPRKQNWAIAAVSSHLQSLRKSGAGEGIRTLDPNLGKGAGRLLRGIRKYPRPLRKRMETESCYDSARRDILRPSLTVDTMWTPFCTRGPSWTGLPAFF